MDIRKILNVKELRARKKDWFGVGVILCLCNTIAQSRQKDSHSHLAPKDVVPFLSIMNDFPTCLKWEVK